MRYVEFDAYVNDFSNLRIVEKPIPAADATHALVRVHSAAINPVDTKIANGYLEKWGLVLPFSAGFDAAGVIHALADDYVGEFKVGDPVFTVNWGNDDGASNIGGAFAEFALFPLNKIAKIPDGLNFDTAAASALVSLTAYQALFEKLNIQSGQKILILGGASAVGLIAVQLAKNAGLWVATTASTRNIDFVTGFGADKVIDYTVSHWWEDVELRDIDAIFDAIGEANHFQNANSNGVVKEGGSFVSIVNALTGHEEFVEKYSHLSNYLLHHSAEQLKIIAEDLVTGKLKLPIDEVFPFTEEGVLALYRKQDALKSNGKNILRIVNL